MTCHRQKHSARWLAAKALLTITFLATSTHAECVSLQGSKACPSFSSFFVDTGVVASLKNFDIIMPSFKNSVAQFDDAVFNSTAFSSPGSDCKAYNSSVSIQYQNTLLCVIAIQDSTATTCNKGKTLVNMCNTSCQSYETAYNTEVKRLCPTSATAKTGAATIKAICSTPNSEDWGGLHSTQPTCVDASVNEAELCGMKNLKDKCAYCSSNATAACCKDGSCTASTTTTLPAATSTAGATKPTNSNTGGAGNGNTTESKSGLSSDALAGIIGGSVGLILIASVIICFRRAKKAPPPKGNALARQYSNSSARYKISNPKLQDQNFSTTVPIPMTTLPPVTTEPTSLGLASITAAGAGAAAVASTDRDAPGQLSYCQALYPYQASMADELDLTPGDIVNVQRVFDDGWAVGINMNTSREGAFPVVCVMFVDESALDDDFEEVNMHSMPAMTLREEDQEGRRSPSGRNSPRSSLPSRSSSPVHLPRRNSSIRDSTVIIPGSNTMTSSPLAGNNGGPGRNTPPIVRDTMMSDASSINRWWDGEK
ncbi:hypothetical protein BGZ76_003438 [Entomortierella beljakovae]|nr:hypothetical protein BGZ76_003438 [Entomortierella beljakovae]